MKCRMCGFEFDEKELKENGLDVDTEKITVDETVKEILNTKKIK